MNHSESVNLERIAEDSWYTRSTNMAMMKYCFKVFKRYFIQGNGLELGSAEGVMTELLAPVFNSLTVVEGAAVFCSRLKERFPRVEVVNALFEDFRSKESFDNIILGHVLEHVEDPVGILNLTKKWLRPNGRILAAVPNARSLHRQAAVQMGLLASEDSMNEADIHHGHRRVFNPESFRNVFLQAGLKIDVFGGYWMKPVSNKQIEDSWTPEMLDAFMVLGERYPDIAGEMYIVASKG